MTPRSAARQGDLFGGLPPAQATSSQGCGGSGVPSPDTLPMEQRQLLAWQERLAAYQAPLWATADPAEPQQTSLLSGLDRTPPQEASSHPEALARTLQPLSLPAESLSFWRWPEAPHAGPALYLVLDRPSHLAHPLLLYVGETACADRRWKGAHDCKSYLAAYREALAKASLGAALSIRFWCDAPSATTARRALEQALIQRWKPPFNKETRRRWNTPFTTEGA